MLRKAILVLLATLLPALAAPAALAATIDVTGGLPRDLGTGEFELTVTVRNISQTEYERGSADGQAEAQLAKRLEIFLPEVDTSNPIPTTAEGATGVLKFYMVENTPHTEDQQTDGTWTFVYDLRVIQTEANALTNAVGTDFDLKVNAKYYMGRDQNTRPIAEKDNFTIKQEIYVAAEAPEFDPVAPIAGGNRLLSVSWVDKATIATFPAAVGARKPSRVVVYVVDNNVAQTATLPAKRFAVSGDTPTTCTYTAPVTGMGACIDCGGATDVYLDKDGIRSIPGFRVVTAAASDGRAVIRNLQNDVEDAPQTYYAFMQYEPTGIAVSQCLIGKPRADNSMTELNGEGDAKVVDFRCFIATAAYGTPLHADVGLFRGFRDRVLAKSWAGRQVIQAYYQLSPPLADFIAAHPPLRQAARAALGLVADALRASEGAKE